ncbi:hypothetical protein EIP91_001751 [Steccherinum ochraceum]|uniref:Uncharacterized protein n=1 Tax=Steccherinum ochraceum TaxID=92696 RepID=A0A4R0RLT2_9APHY|nr:hypothetical protein EIP91_001751 [Steccherinum ochraceum]
MFTPLGFTFCALVALSSLAVAAPSIVNTRQSGDALCNEDRFRTVGAVIQAVVTTRNLTQQLASDPVGSAAIANVTQGLNEIEDGISDYVAAILSGSQASDSTQNQIEEGIIFAFNSTKVINSYVLFFSLARPGY